MHHRKALGGGLEYLVTQRLQVAGDHRQRRAQIVGDIGGHLLATLVCLAIVKLTGPAPWAAALAVGIAMLVMHATRTFHPPAGIDPLVIVTNNMPWHFLFVPVGAGLALLTLSAFLWHNLVRRGSWPLRWW